MSNGGKPVVWMGNSRAVLRGFPKAARAAFGYEIFRLQSGEAPTDSKPMTIVGRGVREIRIRDKTNQYRTVYVVKKASGIVILHAFVKKTRTTAKTDIDLARQRFKAI